jgi:hypothetical protein
MNWYAYDANYGNRLDVEVITNEHEDPLRCNGSNEPSGDRQQGVPHHVG